MSYPSDVTNEQWALLEPVFNPPGKRGPKHGAGLRKVVNAMLSIALRHLSRARTRRTAQPLAA